MKNDISNSSNGQKIHLEISKKYIERQHKLLNEFQSLKFDKWEINWDEINKIQNGDKKWETLNVFEQLKSNKHLYAVYYFDSPNNLSREVHTSYQKLKRNSKTDGEEFKNICSVPKYFHETSCLYVGSVKKDLYGRLICHLGYGRPKEHALFLSQALSTVNNRQKIYFNYYFFEPKFRSINIWAEFELQSRLNPLLGLNRFVKKGAFFVAAYDYKYYPNMES